MAPLGDKSLTGRTREENRTFPGMAHYAGSGPPNKFCKNCKFKGYTYEATTKKNRSNGCAKYYELMRHTVGPDIPDDAQACKYFVERRRF